MSNEGKKVKAHYRGTLDDGTQFDCSYDRNEPIEFTCMAGQMIPGFDAAVKDMAVGEKKTVKIPAADAYGEYNPQAVQEVPVSKVPQRRSAARWPDGVLPGPHGTLPGEGRFGRQREVRVRYEPRARRQRPHVRD